LPLRICAAAQSTKRKRSLQSLLVFACKDFPVWQQLRTLQKVRDCIVHAYGYVARSRDEKFLRELAAQEFGISIDEERILLTKAFCEWQVHTLRTLFSRLFLAAGWNP